MQRDLLRFALVKFAPLFNAPKKHILYYFAFEMAAVIISRRRHRRDLRARGRRESIFFSTRINLFRMQEEHENIVIFNLLQEIKDDLQPSTRSHTIPGLSKPLATLHFLASGFFQRTVTSLFLYSLSATALICVILCWSQCK